LKITLKKAKYVKKRKVGKKLSLVTTTLTFGSTFHKINTNIS